MHKILSLRWRFLRFLLLAFLPTVVQTHAIAQVHYPREGSQKSHLFDGPYIIYEDKSILVLRGVENNGEEVLRSERIRKKRLKEITVYKAGFLPRRFRVKLKKTICKAPSVYPDGEKLFLVSDIEGNFNTLINLLQQHDIIDDNFDWIFGKGHLVVLGDVFDRGLHVTEMLWFLYRLEDQAKSRGGYVHLILGNHEVMNLQCDLRYVESKYTQFAALTDSLEGIDYVTLWGPESELGRWLRSKNVIEKIGDKLFVHGGVSPQLVATDLSLEAVNDSLRLAIDKPKERWTRLDSLLLKKNGPLWYRGYFELEDENHIRATPEQVETVLKQYSVRCIVVGHTLVEKPVLLYAGHVCAIDVVPPKDHRIDVPLWHQYGALIVGNRFLLADEDGYLEEMIVGE